MRSYFSHQNGLSTVKSGNGLLERGVDLPPIKRIFEVNILKASERKRIKAYQRRQREKKAKQARFNKIDMVDYWMMKNIWG